MAASCPLSLLAKPALATHHVQPGVICSGGKQAFCGLLKVFSPPSWYLHLTGLSENVMSVQLILSNTRSRCQPLQGLRVPSASCRVCCLPLARGGWHASVVSSVMGLLTRGTVGLVHSVVPPF